jgi:RNA recognition motif-containing protein
MNDGTLFVEGFPSTFDNDDLTKLFLRFGTVRSTEVTRDTNGSSLRFGYVYMATHDEACNAVRQLNRVQVGANVLIVAFKR